MSLPGGVGGSRAAYEKPSITESLGTGESLESKQAERIYRGDSRELVLGEKSVNILLGMAGPCGERALALQSWLCSLVLRLIYGSTGRWSGQACRCLGCCSTRSEGLMTVIPAQHLLCEVPGWARPEHMKVGWNRVYVSR